MQKDLEALPGTKADGVESMAIVLCACVVDDTETKEWGDVKNVAAEIGKWSIESAISLSQQAQAMNGLLVEDGTGTPQKKVRKS